MDKNKMMFSILMFALLFCVPISARSVQQPTGFMQTKFCDLLENPDKFDGKLVAVSASYQYMFELQELFCMNCRSLGRTWLEFSPDLDETTLKELEKAPRDMGIINGIFYGKFHSSGGPFGHMGFKFQFEVIHVSHVKVICKNKCNPYLLSKRIRKKLCQ